MYYIIKVLKKISLILILSDLTVKKFFNADSYNNKPVDDFTDRIESFVYKIKQQEFFYCEYT